MAFDPRKIRQWFLYAALAIVGLVLVAYLAKRWSRHSEDNLRPQPLSAPVARTTHGFSLSKAEGGHTLFTIHAAQAVEYKEGQRAELKDVNIVIYGKAGDRYDQISGRDFAYDPQTGEVQARGDVSIDLETNPDAASSAQLAPPREQKNIIHVRTSNLNFNQKTGIAVTNRQIQFRLPQATGSALGAEWDANQGILTLQSQVAVNALGTHAGKILASHATLSRVPHQVLLQNADVTQPGREMTAQQMTAFLDNQNQLQHISAAGDVRSTAQDAKGEQYQAQAPAAEFFLGEKSKLQKTLLRGGVVFSASGARSMRGSAQDAVLNFDADQRLSKLHASGDVHMQQLPQPKAGGQQAQSMELIADAVDLFSNSGRLQRGVTSGAARLEIQPQAAPGKPAPEKTVVTAAKFNARFNAAGQIKSLEGAPDAKIVSPSPDTHQQPRISTSERVLAVFDAHGEVTSLTQTGNLQYDDGQREAFAQQGRYTPADQILVMTGAPRVTDAQGDTTAEVIRMNRATGDAFARGDVKTTYENKPQPGGALLASGSPVHVVAAQSHASKSSGVAEYTGNARLWQDANIIQAPQINFDRAHRSMTAQGTAAQPVESVLVESSGAAFASASHSTAPSATTTRKHSNDSQVPARITARRFTYQDDLRKAHYEGNVIMISAEGTVTSDSLDVFLKPSTAKTSSAPASAAPSQIDHAIAQGNVHLQQPGRTGSGEKLVYTDAEQKFVLTGSPGNLPEVTDAEHGLTRGDRLIFYRNQERVLVESAGQERAFTQTRVK